MYIAIHSMERNKGYTTHYQLVFKSNSHKQSIFLPQVDQQSFNNFIRCKTQQATHDAIPKALNLGAFPTRSDKYCQMNASFRLCTNGQLLHFTNQQFYIDFTFDTFAALFTNIGLDSKKGGTLHIHQALSPSFADSALPRQYSLLHLIPCYLVVSPGPQKLVWDFRELLPKGKGRKVSHGHKFHPYFFRSTLLFCVC